MMKIIRFLENSGDYVLFGIVLIVLLILFMKDFDMGRRSSWFILLGILGLGVAMFARAIKKNRLLKDLEEREKALRELEAKYDVLKNESKITEERYNKAREELAEAKKKMARDILAADEKLKQKLEEIDKVYEDITPDEMIARSKALLNETTP